MVLEHRFCQEVKRSTDLIRRWQLLSLLLLVVFQADRCDLHHLVYAAREQLRSRYSGVLSSVLKKVLISLAACSSIIR